MVSTDRRKTRNEIRILNRFKFLDFEFSSRRCLIFFSGKHRILIKKERFSLKEERRMTRKIAWPRNDVCEVCGHEIHLNLYDVWIHDEHWNMRYPHYAIPKDHKGVGTVACSHDSVCTSRLTLWDREWADDQQLAAALQRFCDNCQAEAKTRTSQEVSMPM